MKLTFNLGVPVHTLENIVGPYGFFGPETRLLSRLQGHVNVQHVDIRHRDLMVNGAPHFIYRVEMKAKVPPVNRYCAAKAIEADANEFVAGAARAVLA